MERLTISTGNFEVNCSILSEDGLSWIVDPGGEAGRIIALLEKKGLIPKGILLTHAHFDHIGAVNALQAAFPDLKLTVHPNDLPVITHPMNQLPPDYPAVEMPKNIFSTTDAPGCEIIETPGHTPGGVCYYFASDKLLLAGDTLFAGSVGRTDLPGGNMSVLMRSLKKLTLLPDDTFVIPGHGPHTTIGAEKASNPFLQSI
jgi:glyoxylase-like metal-dependent hydrolase (beta-lactamase superfamily II)